MLTNDIMSDSDFGSSALCVDQVLILQFVIVCGVS